HVARAYRLHVHEGGAGTEHVELGGSGVGEVDEAVVHEWATVVDLHDHALAVLEVGDAGVAGGGHHLVGGAHAVHVIGLAVGSAAAVELQAVPGGDAAVVVAQAARHQGVGLAEHGVARGIAIAARRDFRRHRVLHL